MRKFLPVSLIWFALTGMLSLENSWKYSGLVIPDRIDLYNNEGVIDKDELSFLYYTNPDILFVVSSNVKCSINDNDFLTEVLAVSADYNEINPVYLVRGSFNLENAVLLGKDYAYELFNTDDVIGENIIINGKLHSISGIFELPPLITGVSSEIPEIITSIDNSALNIEKIQLLQTCTDSTADRTAIESLINNDNFRSLELDTRYRLFCQLRKGLYLLTALLIILSLLKILKRDLLRRKELFRENFKKYYLLKTLTVVVKSKPHVCLIPAAGIFLLVRFFCFIPWFPPGFVEIHSLKELFFRPLRFIIGLSANINPAILLPCLYEAGAFLIITLLFLPGYIGISLMKSFLLKDTLFIPALNIIFTLLFTLLKIEPVFDFKINLLLLLLITVYAVGKNTDYSASAGF